MRQGDGREAVLANLLDAIGLHAGELALIQTSLVSIGLSVRFNRPQLSNR